MDKNSREIEEFGEGRLNSCMSGFLNACLEKQQTLHTQMVDPCTVMEAPEPRHVLWPNLVKKFYERQLRQYLVYGIVFLTVVFCMIPISFMSAITSFDNVRKTLLFLKVIIDRRALKTVLQACLPQLALFLSLAFLPNAGGISSQSHAVRAYSRKYFYFVVFNVFLGVTISGTTLNTLKTIINHPAEIMKMLAKSLAGNATFFLTYVALK